MTRRRRPRGKLRSWRNRLDLSGAVIAGRRSLPTIVYGYGFPSWPDRIKIGFSSRGLERIVEQSTSFPEIPKVVFVLHHRRAADLEKAFHKAFRHRQVETMGVEWFAVGLREILAHSPALRRAAGRGGLVRWMRRLATLAGCLLGAAAYPALAVAIAGLGNGVPLGDLSSSLSGYVLSLIRGDLGIALGWAREAHAYVRESGYGYAAAALAPCLVPAALPWLLRPRQIG